jgi:CubicO group peptidase (beta-lactamase class C family)
MSMSCSRRKFVSSLSTAACLTQVSNCFGMREFDRNAVPATGVENNLTSPIDDLMVKFLSEHTVPGAAIAVGIRGKLVYARGFGYANQQTKEQVQPNSLFRIASLSKPITAVAILKLWEAKKLDLDDRVHELLALKKPADNRWRSITVKHLLSHLGGWDHTRSFDGMFVPYQVTKELNKSLPLSHDDVIEFMLTKPLDTDPGSHYAYSNFGYFLLGRVIEKTSGEPYQNYVQDQIFKKLQMVRPKIGSSLYSERSNGEVNYYDEKDRTTAAIVGNIGEQVPLPYGGFDMSLMDSHGGWIASAVDMVRFASDLPVRGSNRKSTTLRQNSLELMDTPFDAKLDLEKDGTVKKVRYGLGWSLRDLGNNRYNAWHTGELDGTSAILVRRSDDKCWAILLNARANSKGEYLPTLIDPLVHQAVDSVKRWPEGNLFSKWLTSKE